MLKEVLHYSLSLLVAVVVTVAFEAGWLLW